MKKGCGFMLLILILSLWGCTAAPAEEQTNFRFLYHGTVIAIDGEAAPVLEALGTPKSYTEQPSCAFDGVEKTYYYGSFYLTTYPKEDADRIARIWFADDSAATQEGIRIGSSQGEVASAYETEIGEEPIYTQIQKDSKLTIFLEDGLVSSIEYALILP